MNWIDSLNAKSLFTICARLAATIGSTESVIQGTPEGSSFSFWVQNASSRSAMRYFALGKVGTQRPLSSRVFQPTWSTCRCVHITMSISSGLTPTAARRARYGVADLDPNGPAFRDFVLSILVVLMRFRPPVSASHCLVPYLRKP